MTKRMLIDAGHPEETRVVVLNKNNVEEFDYERSDRRPLKGNIYLAKVTRVEPSLQAAFVDYGGNRHGFLPFSEIHPDYYRIPISDREALLAEEEAISRKLLEEADEMAAETEEEEQSEAGEVEPSADEADEQEGPESEEGEAEDQDGEDQDLEAAQAGDAGSEESGEEESGEKKGRSRRRRRSAKAKREEDSVVEELETESSVDTLGGDEVEEQLRRRAQLMRRYKIQEVIKRRQVILVQVTKEERGTKGAALTTYLSLAGRYCVLMPNSGKGGGISRKIGNVNDRRRLKQVLSELEIPSGMAVIVRTAGSQRSKAEIRRDYEYLIRLWDQIRNDTLESTAPALIHEEGNLLHRAIRDQYTREMEEVLVEGEEGYKSAKAFMKNLMPSHAKKVQLYKDDRVPLFARYKVEAALEAMHSPQVQLRSGGSIVINPTEALVAIDVNSGKATRERHIEETALKTNIEAAEEIGRQLRLRDLAGLIVIDFIDMEESRHNREVERKLKEALKTDRARIQLGRISPFGLLELSRQRLRPSLQEMSSIPCPVCHGSGLVRSNDTACMQILRALTDIGINQPDSTVQITLNGDLAIYLLNEMRRQLGEIEERYGTKLLIEPDSSMTPGEFEVARLSGGESKAAASARREEEEEEDESASESAGRKRGRRGGRRRKKAADREQESREEELEEQKAEEEDEEAEEPESKQASEDDEEEGKSRRRRRRGRRGGRRRSRKQAAEEQDEEAQGEAEGEEAESGEAEEAQEAQESGDEAESLAEGEAAEPEEKPKRRRSTRGKTAKAGKKSESKATKKAAEPEATEPDETAEASAEQEPEAEEPEAEEPVSETAAAETAGEAEAADEQEPEAEEPKNAPEEVKAEEAPPAPKKRGWWNLGVGK